MKEGLNSGFPFYLRVYFFAYNETTSHLRRLMSHKYAIHITEQNLALITLINGGRELDGPKNLTAESLYYCFEIDSPTSTTAHCTVVEGVLYDTRGHQKETSRTIIL